MLYKGLFKDIQDNLITVYILTDNDRSEVVEIGNQGSDILFTKDPVNIEMDVENTFDIMFIKTMTLNILTKKYLGDSLFTGNPRSVIVNVWKDAQCIFAGFVDPNVYSQPFDHYYDELTLECSDSVATLQYYNYAGINDQDDYDARKAKFGEVTFSKIIYECLREIPTLNLNSGAINNIYYDGSVLIDDTTTVKDIFSQIKISEQLWLGDEFDDIMTEDEVLEEVLRYLDLKVRQEGCNFYIYSLQSIFAKRTISWYPICLPEYYIKQETKYSPAKSASAKPRELLIDVQTGEEREGNELTEELGTDIEQAIDSTTGNTIYVKYYYVVLPSGDKVKTSKYELAESTDDILKIGDTYKVLNQTDSNYNWSKMRTVSASNVASNFVITDEVSTSDNEENLTDKSVE